MQLDRINNVAHQVLGVYERVLKRPGLGIQVRWVTNPKHQTPFFKNELEVSHGDTVWSLHANYSTDDRLKYPKKNINFSKIHGQVMPWPFPDFPASAHTGCISCITITVLKKDKTPNFELDYPFGIQLFRDKFAFSHLGKVKKSALILRTKFKMMPFYDTHQE